MTGKEHWAHVEDPKEPVQVRLPGRNHFFVIPRMKKSGNSMSLASLDDLVLYCRDSPAIGRMVGGRARIGCGRTDLRGQMIYPVTHGPAELVQFLSVHPPFQGSADISAVQPELNVIGIVGHQVLVVCKPGTSHCRRVETYPDHGEKDDDGAKYSLCWCDAGDLLHEIEAIDGHVQ